jgi:integrase
MHEFAQFWCVRVKLPKRERRRVVPLETAAVTALIDAVPDEYRTLILATAGTGLRQGEAFGISTGAVDFCGGRSTSNNK